MDNLQIASYLSELMKEYNRVSLPCLGSFIGSYQTSYIENKTIIHSPFKKINFYQNEIWNDEKLEKLIAQKEHLSLGSAKEKLAFWIDEVCLKLATGEKVELPNIGTFHVNKDNRLMFSQESEDNLLLESFGLNEIYLKPLEGVTFHPTPNIKLIENTKNKKKINFKLILIFILIFIGLGAAFLFISFAKERNVKINESLGLLQKEDSLQKEEPILIPKETPVSGVTFRILVSSFGKYNEAKSQIKLLEQEGYSPSIYPINASENKYGVCIGNFETQTEAKYMLGKIVGLDSTKLFKTATITSTSPDDKPL